MPSYSSEMKETMVRKLCTPGGPSALHLSKQTGISQTALSRWKIQLGGMRPLKNRISDDLSPEEKLQVVFEALSLDEQKLGEFLRKKGLHSNQIDEWKREALSSFVSGSGKRGRPRKDTELAAAQEKIKHLERDLSRKNRALAEQTALVILQKKVQALWGQDEDDE